MSARDFRRRVARRAAKGDVVLSPDQLHRLEAYFRLLAHWNRTINLTALALEPPDDLAIDRLLIEPLAAARFIQDRPLKWLDVGSGGGSPAIPLKIVRPGPILTMVESKSRKVAFLQEVVRELALEEARVFEGRFEDLARTREFEGMVELITVRAVAPDRRLMKAIEAALTREGRVFLFGAAWRGRENDPLVAVQTVRLTEAPESSLIIAQRASGQA